MNRTEALELIEKAKAATQNKSRWEISGGGNSLVIFNDGTKYRTNDSDNSIDPTAYDNAKFISAANPAAITRLAQAYVEALEMIRFYSNGKMDSGYVFPESGEIFSEEWFANTKDILGKRARDFLRKHGEA